MYDELVKKLRNRRICVQSGGDLGKDFPLMREAADAIGELSMKLHGDEAAIAGMKREIERMVVSVNKPRWISVTERLPEKMQYVLVRYQNNDMAVASWFGGDEQIRFWRAMTDEGWCADCDTEPTHWMPLPQPPKEES